MSMALPELAVAPTGCQQKPVRRPRYAVYAALAANRIQQRSCLERKHAHALVIAADREKPSIRRPCRTNSYILHRPFLRDLAVAGINQTQPIVIASGGQHCSVGRPRTAVKSSFVYADRLQ